jgi:hypothetical protein
VTEDGEVPQDGMIFLHEIIDDDGSEQNTDDDEREVKPVHKIRCSSSNDIMRLSVSQIQRLIIDYAG